jgi:hypothetical protein
MEWISERINSIGGWFLDKGRYRLADPFYNLAALLDPKWGNPRFNRGLVAKFDRRWADCFRHTLQSTEINPDFAPGWWNLGIAATAIGDWAVARRAWGCYGIKMPEGVGPPNMDLGPVPIRISPDSAGEVVWCLRIDPARAVIRNIPLPDNDRAFGDVLLHDGEPQGHRILGEHKVPVFNELALLVPSSFQTYAANVTSPDSDAAADLESMAADGSIGVEDWSNLRILCTQCSEGTLHEHEHEEEEGDWKTDRSFAIAAKEKSQAIDLLDRWESLGYGREVHGVECVFSRE